MYECGLNSVRKPASSSYQTCYTPASTEFVDWVKMANHGLIETSQCDSLEDFSALQQVLRANTCSQEVSEIDTNSLSLTKKHLELEGVQCDTEMEVIGGHCVYCSTLCANCELENTNDLIYGFYIDGFP